MKKQLTILSSLLMAASMTAQAGRAEHYQDMAKVVNVEPIYRTVEITSPERHCWDEDVEHYHPARGSATGTILGGIIGGVVANAVSHGSHRGRDAATVAGVMLGGAIGHDASRQRDGGYYTTSTERRCEVTHKTTYEQELVGYDVTYRYHGRLFTTRTHEHPGKMIPVDVDVRPERMR
jgi:uncharacterized protein YcfJ